MQVRRQQARFVPISGKSPFYSITSSARISNVADKSRLPYPDQLRCSDFASDGNRWRCKSNFVVVEAHKPNKIGINPILHGCEFDTMYDLAAGERIVTCVRERSCKRFSPL